MPYWERLYYASPVWLQSLAVSALGFSIYRQRYGRESRALFEQLRESEHWSADRLSQFTNAEVRRVVAHAFTHVPYYRNLAKETGVAAADIQSSTDLHKLPVLEKSEIRGQPEGFVSDKQGLRGRLFELNTSGTSGTPLTIFCDRASRRRHYAFWARLRSWFGITPLMHRATFFGRIICAPDQAGPPFWRYDFFQKNHLFSSYHLSEANLSSYYQELCHLQPPEILGYPSSLFILASYMVAKGLVELRPRVVFTTAETLLAHQRKIIEQAFGTAVVDQYGCTEMALFVSQCERGAYHLHPEHGLLEVLGPDNKPVPEGTPGEAVCTGFVNMAMPLIRYRLGDQIVQGRGACSCGRSFPVISELVGRVDDILITPSGRFLGRLDPVFKPLSGIRETQIVQTSLDRLLVKLVVDGTFSAKERESLLYELHKRTGDEMRIDLEFLQEIPKERNGKFRSVLSLIPRTQRSV